MATLSERPTYPTLPVSGPRNGAEVARVVATISKGKTNNVVDLDLTGDTSPVRAAIPYISRFSYAAVMNGVAAIDEQGSGYVVLSWTGPAPALARILVVG